MLTLHIRPPLRPIVSQIASSCASPLMGRLATIFRPTNLFLGCTTLFILGGCICGSAQNTTVFLLGRAVTGAGAGGLFTTANVLLVEAASVERRGLLIGSVNAIATAGGSLGGVIAGAFAASRYGWVSEGKAADGPFTAFVC